MRAICALLMPTLALGCAVKKPVLISAPKEQKIRPIERVCIDEDLGGCDEYQARRKRRLLMEKQIEDHLALYTPLVKQLMRALATPPRAPDAAISGKLKLARGATNDNGPHPMKIALRVVYKPGFARHPRYGEILELFEKIAELNFQLKEDEELLPEAKEALKAKLSLIRLAQPGKGQCSPYRCVAKQEGSTATPGLVQCDNTNSTKSDDCIASCRKNRCSPNQRCVRGTRCKKGESCLNWKCYKILRARVPAELSKKIEENLMPKGSIYYSVVISEPGLASRALKEWSEPMLPALSITRRPNGSLQIDQTKQTEVNLKQTYSVPGEQLCNSLRAEVRLLESGSPRRKWAVQPKETAP